MIDSENGKNMQGRQAGEEGREGKPCRDSLFVLSLNSCSEQSSVNTEKIAG